MGFGQVGVVHAEPELFAWVVGCDGDRDGSAHELAVFNVESQRVGVDAVERYADLFGGGFVGAVGCGDGVFEVALTEEVRLRDGERVGSVAVGGQVVDLWLFVRVVGEAELCSAYLDVVGDAELEFGVGVWCQGLRALVFDDRGFGVLGVPRWRCQELVLA